MILLKKINAIDTSKLVNKTDYNAKVKDIEDKIPDITKLATNGVLHTKINVVKDKLPSITNFDTTDAFTAAESKIPDISDLVKRNRL